MSFEVMVTSQSGIETWNVLIVDDNATHASLLQMMLLQQGATAHVAHSAEQALRILHNADVNVLLVDLAMPQVSGAKLLRQMHYEQVYHPQMCIVAVTATQPQLQPADLSMPHFHAILRKPIQRKILLDALTTLVYQPNSREHWEVVE
jgi:CheY-like chemotaxis protein